MSIQTVFGNNPTEFFSLRSFCLQQQREKKHTHIFGSVRFAAIKEIKSTIASVATAAIAQLRE